MTGEIIFYQSEDGTIRLETRLENETLWLKILESKETDYATLRALLPPC